MTRKYDWLIVLAFAIFGLTLMEWSDEIAWQEKRNASEDACMLTPSGRTLCRSMEAATEFLRQMPERQRYVSCVSVQGSEHEDWCLGRGDQSYK